MNEISVIYFEHTKEKLSPLLYVLKKMDEIKGTSFYDRVSFQATDK